MPPILPPLLSDGLTIEVSGGEPKGAIRLIWRGRSGSRNPSEILTPYFKNALETAAANMLSVEMHFEALEHFNSSTVAALIHLIQSARGAGVPVTFVYDQKQKWQKLSFEAMRVFVKGDGRLQVRSI